MKRNDLIIAGRKIGTYTGWDELEVAEFVFYEFVPDEGINLTAGDLNVLYDHGLFQYYEDDENDSKLVKIVDMLDVLKDVPRFKPVSEIS